MKNTRDPPITLHTAAGQSFPERMSADLAQLIAKNPEGVSESFVEVPADWFAHFIEKVATVAVKAIELPDGPVWYAADGWEQLAEPKGHESRLDKPELTRPITARRLT